MKIVGNVIMFVSCVIMTVSGLPKKKQVCLLMQTIQIFGMAIGNLFLGSFPGCASNACAGIRNVLCYNNKLNVFFKLLTILISGTISLVFNNIGWFVVFPIAGTTIATLLIDVDNIVHFKWMLVVCNALWFVHDFYIGAFVAVIFDALCIIANVVGIIRVKNKTN